MMKPLLTDEICSLYETLLKKEKYDYKNEKNMLIALKNYLSIIRPALTPLACACAFHNELFSKNIEMTPAFLLWYLWQINGIRKSIHTYLEYGSSE